MTPYHQRKFPLIISLQYPVLLTVFIPGHESYHERPYDPSSRIPDRMLYKAGNNGSPVKKGQTYLPSYDLPTIRDIL